MFFIPNLFNANYNICSSLAGADRWPTGIFRPPRSSISYAIPTKSFKRENLRRCQVQGRRTRKATTEAVLCPLVGSAAVAASVVFQNQWTSWLVFHVVLRTSVCSIFFVFVKRVANHRVFDVQTCLSSAKPLKKKKKKNLES